MKLAFERYLKAIEISSTFRERIEFLVNVHQAVWPEPVSDIYLSDFMDEEGKRNIESIWLFSKNYGMESKNIIESNNIDIAPLYSSITHIEYDFQNYDFKQKADDKSRLTVNFTYRNRMSGMLKGSGINCDYLAKMVSKYILSNLMKKL